MSDIISSVPCENNNSEIAVTDSKMNENVLELSLTERMGDKINFARITAKSDVILSIKGVEVPIISKIIYSKSKNSENIDWIKTKRTLSTILKDEAKGLLKNDIPNISSVLNHNFDRINNFLSECLNPNNGSTNDVQASEELSCQSSCDTCDTCDDEIITVSQAIKRNSGTVRVKGAIVTMSEPFKLIKSYSAICSCNKYNKVFDFPVFKMPYLRNNESICNNCHTNLAYEPLFINALSIELQDVEKFSDMDKLSCILLDTDTKNIRIGENVIVKGTIYVLPKNQKGNLIPVVFCKDNELEWLEANEIVLTDSDIEEIKSFASAHRDSIIPKLVDMFDNSIIGMEEAKESLLYSLASVGNDSANITNNGNPTRTRERLHTLLIGDPGQAKSSLLRKAVKLIKGGRYETCQTSSGRSLTAIIEKDNEQKILRLGPLALATQSVCALNEIATMLEEEQKYLLDILEEGFFTINKHGHNSKINAATVVIASANFRDSDTFLNQSKDDIPSQNYGLEQIPLDKALIDRFDLIVIVVENREPEALSNYTRQKLHLLTQATETSNYDQFLQKYIEYARNLNVSLDQKVMNQVEGYYIKLKLAVPNIGSPRILETIVRLCKVVAKLKLKEKVDEIDVIHALNFFDKMIRKYSDIASRLQNNPLITAHEECVKLLREYKGQPMSFEDIIYKVCKKAIAVRYYLEGHERISRNLDVDTGTLRMNNNRKTRRIYEMLKTTKNIVVVKEKPATLQFINEFINEKNKDE